MTRVGFVGSPEVESVARHILSTGDCRVNAWYPDTDPEDFDEEFVELDELIDAPLIVVSTGIDRCRRLARRLGESATGRNVIIHDIRALEGGELITASEIFSEETPTRRIGFVTGPTRLDDVRDGLPASAVCASHFPEVHELVDEAMRSSNFRVYHNRDLVGAELSAVYARLVAVMSGVVDGLELGTSLKATLFARGLAEMKRIVTARDGSAATSYGLAGAGNLYIDTLDESDVDTRMGHFLVEDPERTEADLRDAFGSASEEILDAIAAFGAAGDEASVNTHLLDGVRKLVAEPVEPDRLVEQLMALPSFEE